MRNAVVSSKAKFLTRVLRVPHFAGLDWVGLGVGVGVGVRATTTYYLVYADRVGF